MFPNVRVGFFGGGQRQTTAEITIAVVKGLATDALNPNAHFRNTYLLVADEVHRYGAPKFAQGLLPCAAIRLGLTATLERTDDGVNEILLPYLGAVVYKCGFREARKNGRLAPATIALLGIAFNEEEQEAYDHAFRRARDARSKLVRNPVKNYGGTDLTIMIRISSLSRRDAWQRSQTMPAYLLARG
jgi:RNA polymerase primary sigma factor